VVKAPKTIVTKIGAAWARPTHVKPPKSAAKNVVTSAVPICRPAGKTISVPPAGCERTTMPEAARPAGGSPAPPRSMASAETVRAGSLARVSKTGTSNCAW
jgi:hypothetical protein